MYCICKLHAISQAGRRRFEPGLPLHRINKLRKVAGTTARHILIAVSFPSVSSPVAWTLAMPDGIRFGERLQNGP
jgi:hypothetical protein